MSELNHTRIKKLIFFDLPSCGVHTECQATCELSYELCGGVREKSAISYKGLVSLTCCSVIVCCVGGRVACKKFPSN